ncbi:MAG TPA: hypothetical protein VHV55_01870 [Pirellulales bacterium]|jgi:biotin operon repressor|nr:hypothetical protein [Pirellulales bacterium]
MPRFRSSKEGAATLVGRLLLLIAGGKETSASLAKKLDVSPRQVNRYVLQLIAAGWQIERVGEWLKHDYYFELKTPRIIVAASNAKPKANKKARRTTPKQK